jgi:predicted nucleic acid-binding protein
MKLVDTSSWIDYLRKLDSEASLRVQELVLSGEAGWCEMTLVELWNGVRGAREKRELAELEKEITLFSVDSAAWQVACKLALRCRDAGLTAPTNDIVIAACALNYGLDVEHCDVHFEKIMAIAAKM